MELRGKCYTPWGPSLDWKGRGSRAQRAHAKGERAGERGQWG